MTMRYIEGVLQPGETVRYAGSLHWIVYFPAIVLLLCGLATLQFAGPGPTGLSWLFVSIAFALGSASGFLVGWFRRWTTEIDVTNRRIVYKRGFIKRHTVEMNMDKVESVDVDQSIFGRLLNYGDITIHGTGIGLEPLRGIAAPLEFRNHVTAS